MILKIVISLMIISGAFIATFDVPSVTGTRCCEKGLTDGEANVVAFLIVGGLVLFWMFY